MQERVTKCDEKEVDFHFIRSTHSFLSYRLATEQGENNLHPHDIEGQTHCRQGHILEVRFKLGED